MYRDFLVISKTQRHTDESARFIGTEASGEGKYRRCRLSRAILDRTRSVHPVTRFRRHSITSRAPRTDRRSDSRTASPLRPAQLQEPLSAARQYHPVALRIRASSAHPHKSRIRLRTGQISLRSPSTTSQTVRIPTVDSTIDSVTLTLYPQTPGVIASRVHCTAAEAARRCTPARAVRCSMIYWNQ